MRAPIRLAFAPFAVGFILATATSLPAQPPPPTEYARNEIQTDHRVMLANVADANYHIDRGVKAVTADLPDLAKVSMLRATGRVAQIADALKSAPEKIERVAMVLFTPREEVRKPLRESLKKVRDEFGAVEQAMYAFRKDMLRKGIFGEELKQQVAVLDAAAKLLPSLKEKDPALAEKVSSLIDQINQALANGDNVKAAELIKQLNALLSGSGHQKDIDAAKQSINDSGGGGTGNGTGNGTSNGGQGGGLGGGGTGGGQGGGAGGSRVVDNGDSITITDPTTGKTLTVPKRFVRNNQFIVPEATYVGGEGQKLTGERELKGTFTTNASGGLSSSEPTVGRERDWDFSITETPGARKFADDGTGMATQLVFRDNKRKTDFKLTGWSIKNASGQEVGSFGAQDKVDFKFKESGLHAVTVSGETDWGNKFNVTVEIKVAL
jgi:hypothetical protein